jgi:uncharacterized repeat protein (TIGR02543 family)
MAALLLCAACGGSDDDKGCKTPYTVLLYNLPSGAQTHKVCADDTLRPTIPPKPNETFVGWYSDRELTQRVEAIAPTGKMTLYARYIAVLQVEGSTLPPGCGYVNSPHTFFVAYEDEPVTQVVLILLPEQRRREL